MPHFYYQIKILILIPQYSLENKSKSPYQCSTAIYKHDFLSKMSSICEEMSTRSACAACSFFQLWIQVYFKYAQYAPKTFILYGSPRNQACGSARRLLVLARTYLASSLATKLYKKKGFGWWEMLEGDSQTLQACARVNGGLSGGSSMHRPRSRIKCPLLRGGGG
jgi:hypothetical protein